MSKPLSLFAIEPTHTKEGKPWKRRVFVKMLILVSGKCGYGTTDTWDDMTAFIDKASATFRLKHAERGLQSRCRVVEFVEVRE